MTMRAALKITQMSHIFRNASSLKLLPPVVESASGVANDQKVVVQTRQNTDVREQHI